MATATANQETAPAHGAPRRPDLVSVGTIVWLANELMFFAALFAMYFTIRSVTLGNPDLGQWPDTHFNLPLAFTITAILIASSFTAQAGVWAAERGDVRKLRFWFYVSFLMGLIFVIGVGFEYYELVAHEGLTLQSSAYGSMFYLTTGFHLMHVIGGLIAFLFMLGRTYAAKRFTHQQATSAIVVSYYWHFVDVVWIGLFFTIYILDYLIPVVL
ncbi:heme-copper oxidase subunit III [Lipingzhangella sp. LS1_29]|uniref:cytochrome-c oxidase n=1 Tax=Lipingzhangella rawalii TaxID=2055835 RepID=A0ABU2H060_9ACTN|nr:heme-copper oxidase subunit III [Lipingzhangella rawalii]MDS1268691.1 heme-copper oxidase subunit III [Lipingzhangella rawalii]